MLTHAVFMVYILKHASSPLDDENTFLYVPLTTLVVKEQNLIWSDQKKVASQK